jgi:predicted phage tail protein
MKHLVKIKLLGNLGKTFVREIELMACSTTDIIKGLEANFPNFRQYVIDKHFKLFKVNKERKQSINLDEDMLQDPIGNYDFVLCPATGLSGSGGVFRVIAGIALIGLTFFVPFLQPFGFGIGASLLLGGLAEIISPKSKTPKEQEKLDSYLFNNASKTDYYNAPVPCLFGERIVLNPPLLSQSLTSERLLG